MKIVSVKDKRIKELVEDPLKASVKGFDVLEMRKIVPMLGVIRSMDHPLQLTAFPSWKAHALKPDSSNRWSLVVTRNYRLTFYVDIDAQEVGDLDYEDYH